MAPGRSHDHSEASLRPLRKGRGATPCERWPQRGFRTAFERNLRSSRKRKGKFRFRFPRAAQISSTNLPQTDSVRGKWCLKFAGVGILLFFSKFLCATWRSLLPFFCFSSVLAQNNILEAPLPWPLISGPDNVLPGCWGQDGQK